jgi:hypothetical protein
LIDINVDPRAVWQMGRHVHAIAPGCGAAFQAVTMVDRGDIARSGRVRVLVHARTALRWSAAGTIREAPGA